MPPPATVVELVERFDSNLDAYRSGGYNEAQFRQEFLNPFFEALGWDIHDADPNGIGTVRYPRVVPRDEACARELKKRTLTNLYNQCPTWLDLAHKKLDEAVFAAYNWDPGTTDEQLLAKLLELNLQRTSKQT